MKISCMPARVEPRSAVASLESATCTAALLAQGLFDGGLPGAVEREARLLAAVAGIDQHAQRAGGRRGALRRDRGDGEYRRQRRGTPPKMFPHGMMASPARVPGTGSTSKAALACSVGNRAAFAKRARHAWLSLYQLLRLPSGLLQIA